MASFLALALLMLPRILFILPYYSFGVPKRPNYSLVNQSTISSETSLSRARQIDQYLANQLI